MPALRQFVQGGRVRLAPQRGAGAQVREGAGNRCGELRAFALWRFAQSTAKTLVVAMASRSIVHEDHEAYGTR